MIQIINETTHANSGLHQWLLGTYQQASLRKPISFAPFGCASGIFGMALDDYNFSIFVMASTEKPPLNASRRTLYASLIHTRMKRPFESITETFSNGLERVRENQIKNFENAEKLLVWIVGFSIGGISIIFSNLTTINESYCDCDIRIVLYLLCLSIISGLFFRWAFFKMQLYYQQIEFFLQGAFSNTEAMMETNPQDLSNVNEINEIIRRLKSDYDLDYNYVLETFDSYDEVNQEIIKQNLKNNYKIAGDNVKREYDFSMDYVQNVYSNAFGVSKEKVQKLLNKSPSKLFKRYSKLSDILFIISCLSFLFAIIYLVILY